ncbi:hypothetical protein [Microlunatus antarcticus]|uniref:Uncharacterized protein n=1 Tax=Microlunatus antarcticus TaxID=53388 RepID=A0A7W5P8A5_9ACTN|nr:hypothetical protein [Microlunatus antarcticus]MBB3327726.1 hypothetical protein [Microlunatus antarcticus]
MNRPARTTPLVGLLLALLLAVASGVVALVGRPPGPPVQSPQSPPPAPTTPSPAPRTDVPTPGAAYPVRKVGALDADRSVLVNARGAADLRYRRAPHNGTRLHFICTGCDADTWLVELPGGTPVGGGPLPDPADVIWALDTVAPDTVAPSTGSGLLVRAPASALWTVTLTPFDAVPVHEQTFGSLGDDVVAVSARSDLRLTCGSASVVRTLSRRSATGEYAEGAREQRDDPGTFPVPGPLGTDPTILAVSCRGRWSVSFP